MYMCSLTLLGQQTTQVGSAGEQSTVHRGRVAAFVLDVRQQTLECILVELFVRQVANG